MKSSEKIFWLNVIFLVALTLNLRAPITSLGPIIEPIKNAYNINSALGGLLTSLPLIAFGSVSFLVAYFSPIRAIIVGIVLIIVGEIYRSFGGSVGLFVGMALLGSGIAIANVLLPSFVKEKFPHKIAFMMGIYSLMLNLSGIFGIFLALPLLAILGLKYSLLIWLPFALIAGKLSAMAQGFGYLIASTSPFIIGLLHDYFESFTQALYLLLFVGAVVSILGFIAYKAEVIG